MPHAFGKLVQRSRKRAIATGSGRAWQGPQNASAGRSAPADRAKSPQNAPNGMSRSSPCPLVAYAQQFHRPVGYCDPEGRSDGAFHQMDVAAMGADKFGGDREPQSAAAGPACCLECLEQMIAGLLGNAGTGVGNLDDRDRAFAAPGDANLLGCRVAAGPVFERL